MKKIESLIIGTSIVLGLFLLGATLGSSIIKYKSLDRTVVVKGLAEKEVKADIVIWSISFLRASNDLGVLYENLDSDTEKIIAYLKKSGFKDAEISQKAPEVVDKIAQSYGGANEIKFRYSGVGTVSLYTSSIDAARESMKNISVLGKAGITFRSNNYENKTQYIFTKLNEIKPSMIKEATSNARVSAQTFANDSQSSLGKIKSARQGQFSIRPRDTNTPYIKKVRIVSTIEYYLKD